jgi:predicted RNase H-like nuclease (RuvC/YqgF family)
MSWLKRRDAEQQRKVISNLQAHNEQLWGQLVAANKDIELLTETCRALRAELAREDGRKRRAVH